MPRRKDLRTKLVYATLKHVPDKGWSEQSLKHGAEDLGVAESMSWRLFPGGVEDAIKLWNEDVDKRMLARLKKIKTKEMKIRDKITLAVKTRLEEIIPHKAAAKETSKYLAQPHHAPLGVKMMFKTVDEMWYWAGDRSTDFNWYTKRALLSAVYASAYIYWMGDTSKDHQKTWDFLDRRIANVMEFGKISNKMGQYCKEVPDRVSEIFKALKP